ncbi:DNA-packaging protein [Paradevosia shaoguanensis]|uniref:Terminase family protein n=1 Tax=Paradevosia shaoguanensis TaxID=1335043 RepID=A0AA41UCE6_9HYPH|nr:terminase family protein [Paradevosia shaoguanensis]MCF1741741.1 terminase family protein [Paradevosia shaoguanensis]MCI0126224.1 terminase family protein [Paradevosia shaoguanensis]
MNSLSADEILRLRAMLVELALTARSREEIERAIPPHLRPGLFYFWPVWAREQQDPPPGDWTTWLLMGGRGSGKTRAGAEWVRQLATGPEPVTPIALVGETMTEAIAVMVKGVSGILSVHPEATRPVLKGTTLTWPNGAEATVLSASDPDRFRGPQFAAAWCDEVAKWPQAESAWDMLQFGLRLGDRPRQLATTTPKPTRLLRRLLGDGQTIVTKMKTEENKAHLAEGFLDAVVGRYRGSVLGRQELDGEMIEDLPDALWNRDMFRRHRGGELGRVVVAVDPPVTGGPKADACGIVVAARVGEGAAILADWTISGARPLNWARRAVRAFKEFEADCIVAEVNQGGDLVKAVLAQVDTEVPVRGVRATRGKWLRAEPVAALYGRGLVAHAEGLAALEDEMCAFGADGMAEGHSPDRVDALVWAVTELMLGERVEPRVRGW